MNLELYGVTWDEIGDVLDKIDCYDSDVEVFGYKNNVKYKAIGFLSCNELVDIDAGTIEEVR